jgi:hypothetical protein
MSTIKKEFDIPKGWNALYNPVEKKVYVMREFPRGGKANSVLSLITKPTKAELLTAFTELELTWTEPTV